MQLTSILSMALLAISVTAQAALRPDDAAPSILHARSSTPAPPFKLTYCLSGKRSCKTRTTGEISKSQREKKELYKLKLDQCYNLGRKYNDKVRYITVENKRIVKEDGKEKERKGKGCCKFYVKSGCKQKVRTQDDGEREEVGWFQKRISSFKCEEKC